MKGSENVPPLSFAYFQKYVPDIYICYCVLAKVIYVEDRRKAVRNCCHSVLVLNSWSWQCLIRSITGHTIVNQKKEFTGLWSSCSETNKKN